MATITETFIHPEVYRKPWFADYGITGIEFDDLDQDLKDRIEEIELDIVNLEVAVAALQVDVTQLQIDVALLQAGEHVRSIITSGPSEALPTAIGNVPLRTYKNATGSNLTLTTNGSETIDGNLTVVLMPYESLTVDSDGSDWFVI